jgi:hypothetical protein
MCNIPTPKRISIKYQASAVTSASLVGSFNRLNMSANPLKKDESSIRSTFVNLIPGTHESQYVMDGEWRKFRMLTIVNDLNETLAMTRE